MTPLMTTQEASIYLKVSARTLERHRHDFTGPEFIRLGRRIFYQKHDLDRWLHENRTL